MIATIYEDDNVRISARHSEPAGRGGTVLLSFTGIGHQMGGIDVQKEEFFGSGKAFSNVIFISDKKRSWGNSLDFTFIGKKIREIAGESSIYSIGNSMGGFLAIHSSKFIPMKASLSFAPQFSVHPQIVPNERRWREYVSSIKEFHIPSLQNSFNGSTSYYIFSSVRKEDRHQSILFPHAGNITHAAFLNIGHNVAEVLKERKILYDLISECLNGGDVLRHLTDMAVDGIEVLSPRRLPASRPPAAQSSRRATDR